MLESKDNGNTIDRTKTIDADCSRIKGGRFNGELLKSILNMQGKIKQALEDGKKGNQ